MRAIEPNRSRRAASFAVAAAILVTATKARAADWPIIQGTEEGRPERAVVPFGFVQVTGEGMLGSEVTGLTKPPLRAHEGERPTFNALESGGTWGFAVRRARPGLRGSLPGTDQRVSYFLLAELGTAPIARNGPALTDANITFSYVPGARVRIGQMKMPTLDEGTESNPVAAEWISFSQPGAQLVAESRVEKGAYVGGASGFRDVGVEVFDSFQWGKVALSYAAMIGNGRPNALEADGPKELAARTTFSWVFSGKRSDPHRQELSVFAWGQRGERDVDGLRVQRIRSGAGVHLEKEPFRIRAEVVHAQGALFLGPSPPFAGSPLVVSPYGRAIGGYVQARIRVLGRVLVGLRYEELHRSTENETALRISRGLSPMAEVDIGKHVRLQATYDARWLMAPHASPDAKTVAAAMGDRVSAQATVVF